ncbi:MAG: CPBP family glutamic-type intramembrane protease [Thermosynechococcaceae cyanobacterium]
MRSPHESADDDRLNSVASRNRSPLAYFILTFALSIPFWIAGALTHVQILPALPVSALEVLCMVGAASILVYRENGLASVAELLKRSCDFQRVRAKIWYVPTLLLMPCIMVLSYATMRLMGVPIPVPQFSLAKTFALVLLFFIAALCEELGWSGYAIDPLQERFGALQGALLLGGVWAAVHFIPLLQAQRSLHFIAWWSLATVAYRVIITWLYNNTGRSFFVATLFHAMSNLTWQLFPVDGSYYDPRVTGAIAAGVAIIVTIGWGPKTLVRAKLAFSCERVKMNGVVVAVSRNTKHTFTKLNQDSIQLLSGLGVEGDAHMGKTIQHRSRVAVDPTQPNLRQVYLIHAELFDELRAVGFDVAAGQMGENITTRGINLLSLPTGTRLHLGDMAIVELTGLRNPCAQLYQFQSDLMAAVLGRDEQGKPIRKAGVMGIVVVVGKVRPGNPIQVELPPEPYRLLDRV